MNRIGRIAIVGTTLLLAAVAGTSSANASRRLACGADAVANLLGNTPANAPASACKL